MAPILARVLCLALAAAPDFTALRQRMVREQIEARGVRDAAVLSAMRTVPRHLFVPAPLRERAYEDTPLPIGHRATISQPLIVAVMTELLEVPPAGRVLEIGTGSGYQAAVLSLLSREVYSIELVGELARSAAQTLREYPSVTVRHGDGYQGWPEKAPFDRIILTAAPPDVPEALIHQLKPGGKLVAPVGEGFQNLVVIDKTRDGKLRRRTEMPVMFVPMVRGIK